MIQFVYSKTILTRAQLDKKLRAMERKEAKRGNRVRLVCHGAFYLDEHGRPSESFVPA